MVEAAKQMQFGWLAGALEQYDRLFGRRHRVIGGMDQQ